ncbi:DsbA family oxidoreductase [Flavobacterium sp. AJR]|uniref:DsbA family oxidoreductase n=1 Tax=Flavobacterium sp. AJR TaxID=1979369 RepID=UPI000B6F3E6E|nr:DsbA family oxidoreductase [Flavobacterium sp. AJR]OUL62004.1 disulfide bond formation protein DsbA [Flavobacterium sp. AJR]
MEIIGTPKMKVEVWSDIMCPFCYIGKRNYETALSKFTDNKDIEIVWKSFQLDPNIPEHFDKKENVYEYLANRKGISYEDSVRMHQGVVQTAKNAGLEYNFDNAVVANSFNAHRMIQLAKTKGLGDQAEERLFYAYFTEGKNFGDPKVLEELGKDIGLTTEDVKLSLTDNQYANKVKGDVQEAQELGINGVPFFIFNRKYAINGAQAPETFLQTLEKSFTEWRKDNPATKLDIIDGQSCTPDGNCM